MNKLYFDRGTHKSRFVIQHSNPQGRNTNQSLRLLDNHHACSDGQHHHPTTRRIATLQHRICYRAGTNLQNRISRDSHSQDTEVSRQGYQNNTLIVYNTQGKSTKLSCFKIKRVIIKVDTCTQSTSSLVFRQEIRWQSG